MGKRKAEIDVKHISTNTYIQNSRTCFICPLRIYHNQDDKVQLGVGNINGIFIILPPYDVKAKVGYITILKLLMCAYTEITGKELLEECYVTRYIKCFKHTSFDMDYDCTKSCYPYLQWEICRLQPKKIICFDMKFATYIGANYAVMNPAVLYYDNNRLKEKFYKQFKEALM